MSLWAHFKWWRFQRRIDRILREAGWPTASVFNGNVALAETIYAPGTHALSAIENADEFRGSCDG